MNFGKFDQKTVEKSIINTNFKQQEISEPQKLIHFSRARELVAHKLVACKKKWIALVTRVVIKDSLSRDFPWTILKMTKILPRHRGHVSPDSYHPWAFRTCDPEPWTKMRVALGWNRGESRETSPGCLRGIFVAFKIVHGKSLDCESYITTHKRSHQTLSFFFKSSVNFLFSIFIQEFYQRMFGELIFTASLNYKQKTILSCVEQHHRFISQVFDARPESSFLFLYFVLSKIH